ELAASRPLGFAMSGWVQSSMAVRRGRCHPPILLASGFAAPVTREKSQFPAQHDSPSLSPVHDGIQPLSNFRALSALPLGGLFFAPAPRGGVRVICPTSNNPNIDAHQSRLPPPDVPRYTEAKKAPGRGSRGFQRS